MDLFGINKNKDKKTIATQSHFDYFDEMNDQLDSLHESLIEMEDAYQPHIESNVLYDYQFKAYVRETLEAIKDALVKSLGYYGSTTVLEDPFMKDNITKDGYTILSNIKFNNSISNNILNIIKDISGDLVRTVGDGSTSSVVAAECLFNELNNNEELDDVSYKVITDTLSDIKKELDIELDKMSIPIKEDNMEVLRDITTVSNNNDDKSGNIIFDIYKEIGLDGMIFLDESTAQEDTYEVHKGMTTNYGYVDSVFANKANEIDCELKEPYVFLFENKLTKEDADMWLVDLIGSIVANKNAAIVFVAPSYDLEVLNVIKNNITENMRRQIRLNIALTTYNSKRDDYHDLAVYLGTKVLNSQSEEFSSLMHEFNTNPEEFLLMTPGFCNEVLMNKDTTTFLVKGNNRNQKAIDALIDTLKEKRKVFSEQTPNNHTQKNLFELDKRIANLRGQIATLYVGGSTERERKTRKYLLDDAIHAAESAIKHGYVSGGNLSVPRIIFNKYPHIFEDEDYEMTIRDELLLSVYTSMINVFGYALRNTGKYKDNEIENLVLILLQNNTILNLKTLEEESVDETTIINSVETDKMILNSVFSIIGLLATSNQYITKNVQ